MGVADGGLKLIEGRAGTGKSYTLAAVREAHEAAGYRVVGLAPTNAVAQDLKADGFTEAGTVHAALFAIKNGRTSWDRRTVVVVDEAAMLDSRVTGEVLAKAKRAGVKVILSGDDRQLASIERGGLFTELRKQHGAAEITEVTRQKVDWQREAARDLAEGRFDSAVASYARPGARAALDELVKRQGWTSAAARVVADPLQLGELRGKEGFFAGAKARGEREAAQRAAGAIGPSLERIGEAEARAERAYRTSVETQRKSDATGIPRLSAAAVAAIGAVAAAPDEKVRGETWRVLQTDKQTAGELRAFGTAAEQRFGEEDVRVMLRAGGRPGAVTMPSVTAGQRLALDRVAELTAVLKQASGPVLASSSERPRVSGRASGAGCGCDRGSGIRSSFQVAAPSIPQKSDQSLHARSSLVPKAWNLSRHSEDRKCGHPGEGAATITSACQASAADPERACRLH